MSWFSYTALSIAGLVFVSVMAQRGQAKDSDAVEINIQHSRQDLRLIAYLLGLVVLLLGIIADVLVHHQA